MKKGNILLIILVVVAIVTASVGGYFYWSSKSSVSTKQMSDKGLKSTDKTLNTTIKKLNYFLPSGWETVKSPDKSFEIGYSLNNADKHQYYELDGPEDYIWIMDKKESRYLMVALTDSPKELSIDTIMNQNYKKSDNYIEKRYDYMGHECLVEYHLNVVQDVSTYGMCKFENGKTVFFASVMDPNEMEKTIQTIKVSPQGTWQTCVNKTEKFSIRYPLDFEIDKGTCQYSIMNYDLVKDIKITNAKEDLKKNWLIQIKSEASSLQEQEYEWSTNRCSGSINCTEIKPAPSISHSEEYNLLNVNYAETDIVIKTGDGRVFTFSLKARNPNTSVSQSVREVFHQIVGSFKTIN